MIVVNRNAYVSHSAARMFALVKDVPAYPRFLPWCCGAEVLEYLPDGLRGRLHIRRGALRQSFSTRNTFRENRRILMQLEDGPFSHLRGEWRFEPVGAAGSEVTLRMEFDFSNPLARMTVGPVFNRIADRLVGAFVARADSVYGG